MVVSNAYDTCLRLAAAHYENFPVASRLLPKSSRPHIAAIYAFARVADDYADEGDRPAAARLAALEEWQWRLHEAVAGRVKDDGTEASLIFIALAETIRTCQLDVQLFEDLLSAFSQDVLVKRYETWTDLLDYCRRSANPVGRLVLRVNGYRAGPIDRQSDAICTALQLANFWQDLAVDWQRGRLYVPREIFAAAGASEDALASRTWPESWQAAVGDAASRTRLLFDEGRPLVDAVRGRLRYELRATWLGGTRILDKLAARDYNVFDNRRPTIGWGDGLAVGWRMLAWRRLPR